MITSQIDLALTAALADRRLLDHPFYRRWEAGDVSMAELAAYAAQYRHFESYLPGFLGRLTEALADGPARDLVAANLADEQGDPVAHVELFARFAAGVGAGDERPSPATAALLATYDELLDKDAMSALAGFLAYESQSAEIARTKADGLRRHHGLDEHAVSFWDHHAQADVRHGAWAREALSGSVGADCDVTPDIRRAADAWWTFLDERELHRRELAPLG